MRVRLILHPFWAALSFAIDQILLTISTGGVNPRDYPIASLVFRWIDSWMKKNRQVLGRLEEKNPAV